MNKEWPGTDKAGKCPSCGKESQNWDLEFLSATLDRFGVSKVLQSHDQNLLSLTCPACKTKFRVPEAIP